MQRIILILSIVTLLISCSDKKNEDCCVYIDTRISIKYLNKSGENLFEIDGGYNESNITVYHKINGEWNEYYEGHLDFPKGIKIVEREDEKYLVVFPSTTILKDKKSETKIKFSDSDIIIAEINKSNPNTIVAKVWYNNVLKCDISKDKRLFEVIK